MTIEYLLRYQYGDISIHMPHTWHDLPPLLQPDGPFISIHMPHTWHDTMYTGSSNSTFPFQSTCHIRGMTLSDEAFNSAAENFNPHATYVA